MIIEAKRPNVYSWQAGHPESKSYDFHPNACSTTGKE
jgi:hypothetical protein